MRTTHQLLAAASVAASLAACTIEYKVAGSFDDYDEAFVGNITHNLMAGTGKISATAVKSGIQCTGESYVTYIPPLSLSCEGQRGKAVLSCSDGRKIDANWRAETCTRGTGEGTDGRGATFRFAFGLDENEARRVVAAAKATAEGKPDLPVYRPIQVRKERGYSTGTGFFISSDGYLVTNFHVIEKSSHIAVVFPERHREIEAQMVQADAANDIAILKVDAETKPIPLADTALVSRGDEVMTLGYPLIDIQGQEQKATFGRVNALTGIKDDVRLLQIDVPIQPGNSGGPLLNRRGEVIGIVTATLDQIVTLRASGSLPQNVNFAIKTDYALPTIRLALGSKAGSSSAAKLTPIKDVPRVVADSESAVVLVIAR